MKIINAKLYNSEKVYKLTPTQANALAKVMADKNHSSDMIKLGEDMVKVSSIKSLESTNEDNIAFLPKYTQEAIVRESGQNLIADLPKNAKDKKVFTKRFYSNGTQTVKSWRALEKEHTDFYEEDYEILSEKLATDENGITHRTYQLGNIVAFRRYKCVLDNGIYYTVLQA